MPILKWIDDQKLSEAVNELLVASQTAKAKALKDLTKNVMDPFSAMFQMSGLNMTFDEWIKSEEARQTQKSFQNFVGDFHQNVLGNCSGWQNMGKGNIIDLVNPVSKIIAEVKNKHNTISGGDLANTYKSMEGLVMPKTSNYKDFTAYHVSIIPKKPIPFDVLFTPPDKTTGARCAANKLIRTIDGASFYKLATGDPNALKDLFNSIPQVIGNSNQQQRADMVKLQGLFKLAYG
jgi:Eco47II-like restriction endonuclease